MQELHQIAQGLLSNLLRNLCSCQVSDTFAPRAPTIEPSEPGSLAMELWLPERYATLDPAVEPPAWRDPSPEQVPERTKAHLLPCCRCKEPLTNITSSGTDISGNGHNCKLRLDGQQ